MPATDEGTVLADATRYLLRSILLVRDADLSSPTPCEEWDLRGLLRHVYTSLEQVIDVLVVRDVHDQSGSNRKADAEVDPVASIRGSIVDLLLVWRSGPMTDWLCQVAGQHLPREVVLHVAAIEMVVHAWDIARACRTDRPIPADLASTLLEVAPTLAEAGAAVRVFAPPLAVATTATPGDRLLALFGRQSTVTR